MHSSFIFCKNRAFARAVFLLLGIITLAGCSKQPLDLRYYKNEQETPLSFNICHGYGCRALTPVKLLDTEWNQITAPLKQPITSAKQERRHIAQAIAIMEQTVGEKSGTNEDKAGATIRGHGYYQLDCIDETANTDKYLSFFKNENLIKFHEISTPARRGTFLDGSWPHNTAVINDKAANQKYVVDSWFSGNGEKPHIVPLEVWLAGWKPE